MSHIPRIGIQIGAGDPFWVQVREVMWQRAQALSVELIDLSIRHSELLSHDEQAEVVEDFLVQEIDTLICNTYPESMLTVILERGIPIIYLTELDLRHPRLTSRLGLYDAAHMLGTFLTERLTDGGTVLVVGGGMGRDGGISRLAGFYAALPTDKRYIIHHVPSHWIYEDVYSRLVTYLSAHPDLRVDAIFGLSDTLALAARDACRLLGRIDHQTLILGINGDLLALASLVDGEMTATVETDVDDIAVQAIDLAYRAARGESLPSHFQNRQHLVTADQVAEVAMRKLMSLANLPTRLIDDDRRNQQQRVVQLETSMEIDRQVGQILDTQALALALTALIRDNYGFDLVRFVRLDQGASTLVEIDATQRVHAEAVIELDGAGPLAYALAHNCTVFIPDVYASHRFIPDPAWPELRARVVVPVHLGGQIIGLLDLHHHRAAHHTREELDGLQLLAAQFGVSLRNAELYSQALAARETAEKADRLKTSLLANVSHELRSPLNVILGYNRKAIDILSSGELPTAELHQNLMQVYHSGEHLMRLINDLLDLSRAEIDELDLLPEMIDTRGFLQEVFQASAGLFNSDTVTWHLDLAPDLPSIEADPVRLRQILLNLLHNASKFTQHGQITLGAEVVSSRLHMWVADTGSGISSELQDQIFDPFVSGESNVRRRDGIGLGLTITRHLVALHGGTITVESNITYGSIFHIHLPLPLLSAPPTPSIDDKRLLLVLSHAEVLPADLIQLAEHRGLTLHQIRPNDDLTSLLATSRAVLLSENLAEAMADGEGFGRQIRAHPQLSQLPIIFYHQDRNSAITDAGSLATGLLLKPLREEALIEAIADLNAHAPEGSILIVEDDPHTRTLHYRIIKEHFPRYRIHAVEDGRAALEWLAHQTPSLVVLDLVMPEVDGIAVLEAMRARSHTAAVPVLVLSGRILTPDDMRRLSKARVIVQTKNMLLEDELAESLRRTLMHVDSLPPHTSALVKQAITFIQQHYNEPLARQAIANAIGVSKDYLGRIFHQEVGLSPWEYLLRYRVLRAKELLQTTDDSITEVASQVGFDTATYFSHIFHREVGCSPRAFRMATHEPIKR